MLGRCGFSGNKEFEKSLAEIQHGLWFKILAIQNVWGMSMCSLPGACAHGAVPYLKLLKVAFADGAPRSAGESRSALASNRCSLLNSRFQIIQVSLPLSPLSLPIYCPLTPSLPPSLPLSLLSESPLYLPLSLSPCLPLSFTPFLPQSSQRCCRLLALPTSSHGLGSAGT